MFTFLTFSLLSAPPHQLCNVTRLIQQGHIGAAETVGSIYGWGHGAAVDYRRAMAAYKVGAEGGDAVCQYQVGMMYREGLGVDVDYKQARAWLEKAAAQDEPNAVGRLGVMYFDGKGVTPSFRRAREYMERAIELGDSKAVEYMQTLTVSIQMVTSQRSIHFTPSSLVRGLMLTHHTHYPPTTRSLRTRRSPPSWTSGWRSTAQAART